MMGSHEEHIDLEQSDDLLKFRKRLWDRYLSLRATTGMNISFEEFWNDCLIRHFISQRSMDTVYDEMSKELEQRHVGYKK